MTHAVRCDGTQAAVLITNTHGELLLTEPVMGAERRHLLGMQPPTAHVTLWTPLEEPLADSYRFAASMQTTMDTSLRLVRDTARLAIDDTATDQCHWPDDPDHPPHHRWMVFTAQATGRAEAAPGVRAVRWVAPGDLQALARRTISWSLGKIPDDEFHRAPGLRPVWVWWLHLLQKIDVYERHAAHVLATARRTAQL